MGVAPVRGLRKVKPELDRGIGVSVKRGGGVFQVEGMAGAKTVRNSVRCAGNYKHRAPEGGRREGELR